MSARFCSVVFTVLTSASLLLPSAYAQSLDGEWRGSGKCSNTTVPYAIQLQVQTGGIAGKARLLGSGRSALEYSFRGELDPATGAIVMNEAASGSNRYSGSVSGRRMTFMGWTGEGNCEYTLDQVGVPQVAAAPHIPQSAASAPATQHRVLPEPIQSTPDLLATTPKQSSDTAKPLASANGDREAFIARGLQEMTAVQRALAALGYYRGNPDGVYGPGTAGAIEAWQRAQQLHPTGYLTVRESDRLKTQALAMLGGPTESAPRPPSTSGPAPIASTASTGVPPAKTPPRLAITFVPPTSSEPNASGQILNRRAFPVGSTIRIFYGHPLEIVQAISTPQPAPWPPEVLRLAPPADRAAMQRTFEAAKRDLPKNAIRLESQATPSASADICQDSRHLDPSSPAYQTCIGEVGQKHSLVVNCRWRTITVNDAALFQSMERSNAPAGEEVYWTGGRWAGGPINARMHGDAIIDGICGKPAPEAFSVDNPTADSPLASVPHGTFPTTTCKGWGATLEQTTGLNSSSAAMRGSVTDADLYEYAARDPGGSTQRFGGPLTVGQLFESSLGHSGTKVVSSANCNTGELIYQYGTTAPERVRFPLASNAPISCASGVQGLFEQFKLMCPLAAAETHRQREVKDEARRRAAAAEEAERALAELERRAKAGDHDAAGRGLELAGSLGNRSKEIAFRVLSAETGSTSLKFEVARDLLDGTNGLPRDMIGARQLLLQAVTAGHAPSMVALADLESHPTLLSDSNRRSYELLEKAVALGNPTAGEKLKQLRERVSKNEWERTEKRIMEFAPWAGLALALGVAGFVTYSRRADISRALLPATQIVKLSNGAVIALAFAALVLSASVYVLSLPSSVDSTTASTGDGGRSTPFPDIPSDGNDYDTDRCMSACALISDTCRTGAPFMSGRQNMCVTFGDRRECVEFCGRMTMCTGLLRHTRWEDLPSEYGTQCKGIALVRAVRDYQPKRR